MFVNLLAEFGTIIAGFSQFVVFFHGIGILASVNFSTCCSTGA
jgi:hypothetical protein